MRTSTKLHFSIVRVGLAWVLLWLCLTSGPFINFSYSKEHPNSGMLGGWEVVLESQPFYEGNMTGAWYYLCVYDVQNGKEIKGVRHQNPVLFKELEPGQYKLLLASRGGYPSVELTEFSVKAGELTYVGYIILPLSGSFSRLYNREITKWKWGAPTMKGSTPLATFGEIVDLFKQGFPKEYRKYEGRIRPASE